MENSYKKIIAITAPILGSIALLVYITKTFTPFGTTLFLFSIALLIVFIILIFTKQQIFSAWSNFAMIYLPMAVILIVITPAIGSSFIDFDKESLALFLSGIFLIASLAIIAVKSYKLRKN